MEYARNGTGIPSPQGEYVIEYRPPPIPVRSSDWQFSHIDFDGAPDSGDRRCGTGESFEQCVEFINELELELESE